jgi:pimeloyl-ACP methyl ester carboxylesterase
MTLRAGNRTAVVHRLAQGYTGSRDRIRGLHLPTLILWGGRDRLVPPEHGQAFAQDRKKTPAPRSRRCWPSSRGKQAGRLAIGAG